MDRPAAVGVLLTPALALAGVGAAAVGVLLTAALALVGAGAAAARPPTQPLPDLPGFLARWRGLHQGYDPAGSPWVRGWLELCYRAARPLAARGVPPDLLTVWGLWLACAALVAAAAGGHWRLLAGVLVVASALGDGVDGAVAALTGRDTRWGYVLDSLVDRASEVVYLAAVVAVGGDLRAALAAGLAAGFHEYLRARAGNAGMDEVGVVTVGERATRVIVCALALAGVGLLPERATVVASGGLVVLALLGWAGFAKLVVAVRRQLS